MKYNCKNNIRPCQTKFTAGESRVQSGLSYTPSDMMRASKEGIAISPTNLNENALSYDEGVSDYDMSVSIDNARGVDINDIWEASQASKRKIRKARKDGAFQAVED